MTRRRLAQKEVTPELARFAVEALPVVRAQGEGAEVMLVSGGRCYVARAEWHAPGPRNPKRHIGVTLYEDTSAPTDVVTLPEVTIYGDVPRESNPTVTLPALPGLVAHSTPELRRAFVEMCDRLGATRDGMAACFELESGWRHDARNPKSGATGFIQFMPRGSCIELGVTPAQLVAMGPVAQLEYVERYFQPYRASLGTIEGCYLSIFYPRARSMKPAEVVARIGSKVYEQNSGFDRDRDGDIEAQEICATIYAVAARPKNRRIAVDSNDLLEGSP